MIFSYRKSHKKGIRIPHVWYLSTKDTKNTKKGGPIGPPQYFLKHINPPPLGEGLRERALEEHISVIHDLCLDVKFVHVVAGSLHSLLTDLCLHLLLIELHGVLLTADDLELVDATLTLHGTGEELTDLSCIDGTTEGGLAGACRAHEDRSSESNLVDRCDDSALSLSSCEARCTLSLSHQHLSLLVAEHLGLDHLLDLRIVEVTIADRMDTCADDEEEIVTIVATLIERRDITDLSVEEPLHSITCRVDTSKVVLRCRNISSFLHTVTVLGCILIDSVRCSVSTDESAELVIDSAASILRVIDSLLDDGSGVFFYHVLTIENLDNDVTLCRGDVLCLLRSHRQQCVEVSLGVVVHRIRVLIHTSGEPLLAAFLTIFLGESSEVSATSESLVDRVGTIYVINDANKEYCKFGAPFASKILGISAEKVRAYVEKVAVPEFGVFENCNKSTEIVKDIPMTVAERDGVKFYFYADGQLTKIVGKTLKDAATDYTVSEYTDDASAYTSLPENYAAKSSNEFILKYGIDFLTSKF